MGICCRAYSFQQCELMTAHYKQPILLIEFDEKKSFNLEVRSPFLVSLLPPRLSSPSLFPLVFLDTHLSPSRRPTSNPAPPHPPPPTSTSAPSSSS